MISIRDESENSDDFKMEAKIVSPEIYDVFENDIENKLGKYHTKLCDYFRLSIIEKAYL